MGAFPTAGCSLQTRSTTEGQQVAGCFPERDPWGQTGVLDLIGPVHLWELGSIKCNPKEVRELETHIPLFHKPAGLQPRGDAE